MLAKQSNSKALGERPKKQNPKTKSFRALFWTQLDLSQMAYNTKFDDPQKKN